MIPKPPGTSTSDSNVNTLIIDAKKLLAHCVGTIYTEFVISRDGSTSSLPDEMLPASGELLCIFLTTPNAAYYSAESSRYVSPCQSVAVYRLGSERALRSNSLADLQAALSGPVSFANLTSQQRHLILEVIRAKIPPLSFVESKALTDLFDSGAAKESSIATKGASDSFDDKVIELLESGEYVKAVVLVRDHYKMPLPEAKRFVDELRGDNK